MPAHSADGFEHMAAMFDEETPNTDMVWGDEIPDPLLPGAPGFYRPPFAEQAHKLCLLGARAADLADFFRVTPVVIDHWLRRYPAFATACHQAQLVADGEVAASLYRMATGQATVKRIKVVTHIKTSETELVEYVEQLPPNAAAATTWLQARRPDQWMPKRLGAAPIDDDLTDLTDAELLLVASGRTVPKRRVGLLGSGGEPA